MEILKVITDFASQGIGETIVVVGMLRGFALFLPPIVPTRRIVAEKPRRKAAKPAKPKRPKKAPKRKQKVKKEPQYVAPQLSEYQQRLFDAYQFRRAGITGAWS